MPRRWRTLLALLVTGLVAGTAGCGGGAEPAAGGAVRAASGVAPELLRFETRTLDGAPFAGSSLAKRPAVLWFWAPWCGSCAGQASSVQEAADQYGAKVSVVGVAGLGDVTAMRQFVKDTEVGGVTHLNDQTGDIWRRFQITEQSVYVLLDATGAVQHRGWLDSEQFTERVKALAG